MSDEAVAREGSILGDRLETPKASDVEETQLIDIRAKARNAAYQAVDAFSHLHPSMRMNIGEWDDLRECIFKAILERMN